MAVYVEAFNNKMQELLGLMTQLCPDVKDLKLLKSSFIMVRNIRPRLPQHTFAKHVQAEFQDQILRKDDAFFLQYDYDAIVDRIAAGGQGMVNQDVDVLNVVGYLKSVWGTLSAEDKETVWKFLHILLKLSSKCAAASSSVHV
jgi:hypothetical protein